MRCLGSVSSFCLLVSLICAISVFQTALADTGENIKPVPLPESDAPRLLAVWPAHMAENAEASTELQLRFDRPINPFSFDLQWRQGSFFECGPIRCVADNRELVIPIRLQDDCQHEIVVNPQIGIRHESGFISASNQAAASSSWRFRTKPAANLMERQPPKVVSIHPPTGSTTARLVMIRIRFDQPMDPFAYALRRPRQRIGHR